MSFINENHWLLESPDDLMIYAADNGDKEFCKKLFHEQEYEIIYIAALFRMRDIDGIYDACINDRHVSVDHIVDAIPHAQCLEDIDKLYKFLPINWDVFSFHSYDLVRFAKPEFITKFVVEYGMLLSAYDIYVLFERKLYSTLNDIKQSVISFVKTCKYELNELPIINVEQYLILKSFKPVNLKDYEYGEFSKYITEIGYHE